MSWLNIIRLVLGIPAALISIALFLVLVADIKQNR